MYKIRIEVLDPKKAELADNQIIFGFYCSFFTLKQAKRFAKACKRVQRIFAFKDLKEAVDNISLEESEEVCL